MNDDQLENAIRAELAVDAAGTPSAGATKLAVRAAVAELPASGGVNGARRWLLPLAAAAVLVALAAASFLVPKALTGHSNRPAAPKPQVTQPTVPPAPVVQLSCPSGQQTVDGLSTQLTDAAGTVEFAYEYYCAGADGNRGYSSIKFFLQKQGKLSPIVQPIELFQSFLMSMSGADGGLRVRTYEEPSAASNGPSGYVTDSLFSVDSGGSEGTGTPVAASCTAPDLKVTTAQVNEPNAHEVVRVTNQGSKTCALWGTPRYTVVGPNKASIRYLLTGPAGGAEGLASSPVLLVAPGHTVSSSIGSDPFTGKYCYSIDGAKAVLPNGVSLGTIPINSCGNLVGYPFVDSGNGSITHPESEAPANTVTGSCVNGTAEQAFGLGDPVTGSDHRHSLVLTVRTLKQETCTISGYPNARLLDAHGVLLQIAPQTLQGPSGGVTGTAPTLTVTADHPVSAMLEWSDAGGNCRPDGRVFFGVGGMGTTSGASTGPVCDLQVHPFVAGTTGRS